MAKNQVPTKPGGKLAQTIDTSGYRALFEAGLLETAPAGLAEQIAAQNAACAQAESGPPGVLPLWVNIEYK